MNAPTKNRKTILRHRRLITDLIDAIEDAIEEGALDKEMKAQLSDVADELEFREGILNEEERT